MMTNLMGKVATSEGITDVGVEEKSFLVVGIAYDDKDSDRRNVGINSMVWCSFSGVPRSGVYA